ncbi:MAG: hypothetical protein ACYDDU_07855 [Dermatophilaceae bacterium]
MFTQVIAGALVVLTSFADQERVVVQHWRRVLLPSATPRTQDTLSVRELQVLRLVTKGLVG